MKQVFQSLSSGDISIVDIPIPSLKKGQVLIKTSATLISSGTERFLINFGKSNLIQKALDQPERVKEVLEKAKTNGIIPTIKSIQGKLDNPLPLGYCNVGTIVGLGEGIRNLQIGQRVISNGYHAEYVLVPENLCSPIPKEVEDSKAVFTILGSIGLQGIRLIKPTLGETVLVSGLGLIGILSAQLLKFNGCKVLGIDPDKKKCELAEKLGIKSFHLKDNSDPISWCFRNSEHEGVDAVLITATTNSSEPIDLAAKVSRVRGRIVLVGVTGIDIKRELFYKKELKFQVSCSYGPGRYDQNYEELGQDYPIGFVRWTEKRNFEAVLHALNSEQFKTKDLISKYFKLENASEAYKFLLEENSSLGIVLTYPNKNNPINDHIKIISNHKKNKDNSKPSVSFIGAGNYAKSILIPCFKKAGANFNLIASESGLGSVFLGRKFGFNKATTKYQEILNDKNTDSVVIVTRHNSHAKLVMESLKSGKNVFVEKPICLNLNELDEIQNYLENEIESNKTILMVGYNRRFSSLVKILKAKLDEINAPKAYIYTCNAGYIDKSHWTQDPLIGGGRLLGEACHFIDLLTFLEGSPIDNLFVSNIAEDKYCPDSCSIQISFKNGSIGTVHYFSNGSKSFPKERIEVFSGSKVFCLDNFRKLKGWGIKNFKTKRILIQDKGQLNCSKAFLNAIQFGYEPPIPYEQILDPQRKLLEALNK